MGSRDSSQENASGSLEEDKMKSSEEKEEVEYPPLIGLGRSSDGVYGVSEKHVLKILLPDINIDYKEESAAQVAAFEVTRGTIKVPRVCGAWGSAEEFYGSEETRGLIDHEYLPWLKYKVKHPFVIMERLYDVEPVWFRGYCAVLEYAGYDLVQVIRELGKLFAEMFFIKGYTFEDVELVLCSAGLYLIDFSYCKPARGISAKQVVSHIYDSIVDLHEAQLLPRPGTSLHEAFRDSFLEVATAYRPELAEDIISECFTADRLGVGESKSSDTRCDTRS